jgi:hypothetical protein
LRSPPHHACIQAKKWRAYFSFPRCVRDLFSTTLLLVGLPHHLRHNEAGLRQALARYGTIMNLQVRVSFACSVVNQHEQKLGDALSGVAECTDRGLRRGTGHG